MSLMIMTHKIKIRDIYYRHKTEVEEKYKIIEKQIKYIKCTFTREMNEYTISAKKIVLLRHHHLFIYRHLTVKESQFFLNLNKKPF